MLLPPSSRLISPSPSLPNLTFASIALSCVLVAFASPGPSFDNDDAMTATCSCHVQAIIVAALVAFPWPHSSLILAPCNHPMASRTLSARGIGAGVKDSVCSYGWRRRPLNTSTRAAKRVRTHRRTVRMAEQSCSTSCGSRPADHAGCPSRRIWSVKTRRGCQGRAEEAMESARTRQRSRRVRGGRLAFKGITPLHRRHESIVHEVLWATWTVRGVLHGIEGAESAHSASQARFLPTIVGGPQVTSTTSIIYDEYIFSTEVTFRIPTLQTCENIDQIPHARTLKLYDEKCTSLHAVSHCSLSMAHGSSCMISNFPSGITQQFCGSKT